MTPLSALRLIPITRSGHPADAIELPDTATAIIEQTAAHYERVGFAPPWIGYLAAEGQRMVGGGGFKSPPQAGRVEIAYGTVREFEGRGIATEVARQLIRISRDADPTLTIAARTLQDNHASMAVLRKLGFVNTGIVVDPEDGEVYEWVLSRER